MTAQVSNIPLSVDYTSRDYYALREDLIILVKNRVNTDPNKQWTGDDPTDFGIALIEAFAYIGDLTNYYIDRIANETYLPTAVQRKNILNLADMYGYTPSGYRASYVTLEFSNESSTAYSLPIGTQVTASVVCDDVVQELFFTTLSLAEVAAATFDGEGNLTAIGTGEATAIQGEDVSLRSENLANPAFVNDVAGELVGSSNGIPNQSFVLSENQVVDGSVTVFVQNGDTYEPWTSIKHLSDAGPADAVYQIAIDEDNFVYINFGDGISGVIPNALSAIKVQYLVGGGTIGNIAEGLVDTIYRVPGLSDTEVADINADVNVTNSSVGVGGSEPEDNRSIRINASKAITAINRAVSLKDYASLSLYATNVGKANATADFWNSVTVYAAPVRGQNDTDPYPGFDASNSAPTSEWTNIQTDVATFLEDKTQIGVSVTVSPPTYVPAHISLSYTPNPQYSSDITELDIKQTLLSTLTYSNLEFEQTIAPEDIEYIVKSLASVRNAKVTALYLEGSSAVRAPIIGTPAQIFTFIEANLSINEMSSNAQLHSLSGSSGTLSPTFDANFYNYNLAGVSTTSTTITVSAEITATVFIDGALATMGSSSGGYTTWTKLVSTPASATEIIPVIITAGDSTTVKVYTVTVSRA
jgi:hypothetical protein